ncbi:uncharacterized protein [Arachis hypogaea]|uniref:uncharacterized protein n=1 Tax=Arachis hypogaea TaxID=3818 RepID=UPI003B226390
MHTNCGRTSNTDFMRVIYFGLLSLRKICSAQSKVKESHTRLAQAMSNLLILEVKRANNVRRRGRGRGKDGKGTTRGAPKLCSYCEKQGHLVDTCYQKHGFPPHMQPNHSNGVPLSANSVNSVVVASNAECNPTVIQNEGKISLDGIFLDRQKEALIALFQQHKEPLHDENLATIHTPSAGAAYLKDDWNY